MKREVRSEGGNEREGNEREDEVMDKVRRLEVKCIGVEGGEERGEEEEVKEK